MLGFMVPQNVYCICMNFIYKTPKTIIDQLNTSIILRNYILSFACGGNLHFSGKVSSEGVIIQVK